MIHRNSSSVRTSALHRTLPWASHRRSATSRTVCVGDNIGPYHLCYELGRGGMAKVFLARGEGRAGVHRFVALKCIHPSRADDEAFVDMFLDEARIVSMLAHPHVCSVLDFDVADGTYYMVMEHLVGTTLGQLRPRLAEPIGDLPAGLTEARRAALVARIIADACEGLHAAHELTDSNGVHLEIVHRDVSPQNLMLTIDGCVKVLDFGVASATDQRHSTNTGEVKGKFSYLQPEVLAGEKPDRRADVWGLGVVCWELLTGRELFHRDNDAATLQAVTTADIPPPSGMRAGIPREYDAIVLRALSRDPAQRYPTARELGRDLLRVIAEQGQAVGLADLAELMAALFPGLAPSRRQLLEVVSQVEQSTMVRLRTESIDGLDEASAQDLELTEAPTAIARRPAPLSLSWQRSRWDGRAMFGVAIGLIGIVVGFFSVLGMTLAQDPDEPPTTVVVQPATVAPVESAAAPTDGCATECEDNVRVDEPPPPIACATPVDAPPACPEAPVSVP